MVTVNVSSTWKWTPLTSTTRHQRQRCTLGTSWHLTVKKEFHLNYDPFLRQSLSRVRDSWRDLTSSPEDFIVFRSRIQWPTKKRTRLEIPSGNLTHILDVTGGCWSLIVRSRLFLYCNLIKPRRERKDPN